MRSENRMTKLSPVPGGRLGGDRAGPVFAKWVKLGSPSIVDRPPGRQGGVCPRRRRRTDSPPSLMTDLGCEKYGARFAQLHRHRNAGKQTKNEMRLIRQPRSRSIGVWRGEALPVSSDERRAWLADGYSQIFRSYVFGPSGFWTMAPLRYGAKFDPFLSLDYTKEFS